MNLSSQGTCTYHDKHEAHDEIVHLAKSLRLTDSPRFAGVFPKESLAAALYWRVSRSVITVPLTEDQRC